MKFEAVFTLKQYILQNENTGMKFSISIFFFFFPIEKRRSKSPNSGNETMTAEGEPCDHHLDCLPGQDQLGRVISPDIRCLKSSPGFKTCILISTTDMKWYAREGQRLSRRVVGPYR